MRNPVRNCGRPGRGSDLEHPKYEAGLPATQPRRPIHIIIIVIIMSSSSTVVRCVAQPVQWLKQRYFPCTINYVQIECCPFSLLPGGYWGSCPLEKRPGRENGRSPRLVSDRNEKLQLSVCLCNSSWLVWLHLSEFRKFIWNAEEPSQKSCDRMPSSNEKLSFSSGTLFFERIVADLLNTALN